MSGILRNRVHNATSVTWIPRRIDGRTYHRTISYGLVSVVEAAAVLGVTSRTVWNLIAQRKLHTRQRGSRVVLRLSEVRDNVTARMGGHHDGATD